MGNNEGLSIGSHYILERRIGIDLYYLKAEIVDITEKTIAYIDLDRNDESGQLLQSQKIKRMSKKQFWDKYKVLETLPKEVVILPEDIPEVDYPNKRLIPHPEYPNTVLLQHAKNISSTNDF